MSGFRGKKLVNLAQENSIPIFSDDNVQLGTINTLLDNDRKITFCDSGQFQNISDSCVIVDGVIHDTNIHFPNVLNGKHYIKR